MDFINETAAVNGLADEIVKGGVCLFNAVKYIYSIAEESLHGQYKGRFQNSST